MTEQYDESRTLEDVLDTNTVSIFLAIVLKDDDKMPSEEIKRLYRDVKNNDLSHLEFEPSQMSKYFELLHMGKRSFERHEFTSVDELEGYEGKPSRRNLDEEDRLNQFSVTRFNTHLNRVLTDSRNNDEILTKLWIATSKVMEYVQKLKLLKQKGVKISADDFLRNCIRVIPNYELLLKYRVALHCMLEVELESDLLSAETASLLSRVKSNCFADIYINY